MVHVFTSVKVVLGYPDVGLHLIITHEVMEDSGEGRVAQHLNLEWTKSGKYIKNRCSLIKTILRPTLYDVLNIGTNESYRKLKQNNRL